jgi:hypothetical protein
MKAAMPIGWVIRHPQSNEYIAYRCCNKFFIGSDRELSGSVQRRYKTYEWFVGVVCGEPEPLVNATFSTLTGNDVVQSHASRLLGTAPPVYPCS